MEVTLTLQSRTSLFWRAMIASTDQALLSGLSFLISIILLRIVPKAEFGYYSVAVPISLFLISLQNAVVNTPLAVLLAKKKGNDRREYVASLGYGQFLVILPAACLGLLGAGLWRLGGLDPTVASIAAALSAAAIGLLYREFLRSYLFAEEATLEVLRMDALYVGVCLCFLAVLYLFFQIRVDIVFLLTGGCALLVAFFCGFGRGLPFPPKSISKSYKENWEFGKWALLGVCVTHAQKYSYLYLLGFLSGSLAVADVSAARLLLMPMMLVHIGWGKIAIPHGSKLREEGQIKRFFKELILSSVVFLVVVAVYVALVMASSEILQSHLLSDKYSSSFGYVVIWGAIIVVGFTEMNAAYGLMVLLGFRLITKISFLVMPLTVGSAYILIRAYGITGGLSALLLGQILLAICMWIYFGKAVFSPAKR